jgi:hypothetical protein
MAGAFGRGAQSCDCEAGLTGVEVAEGRKEAGISDPVGSSDWIIFGNGRLVFGRILEEIAGKVVSPTKDGVLPPQLLSCTGMKDSLPGGGASHTKLSGGSSYIRREEPSSPTSS